MSCGRGDKLREMRERVILELWVTSTADVPQQLEQKKLGVQMHELGVTQSRQKDKTFSSSDSSRL